MKIPWYQRRKPQVTLVGACGGLLLATARLTCAPCPPPQPLIALSTNAGKTWAAASAPTNNWVCVACSADGTRLVAAATMTLGPGPGSGYPLSPDGDGLMYASTDSGATWAPAFALPNLWTSVASSADGTHLVATASLNLPPDEAAAMRGDGLIYTSSDAGMSWTQSTTPSDDWVSVAASADGSHLVAASRTYSLGTNLLGGFIYRSANSGATWSKTAAPRADWSLVASSADGAKLFALGDAELYSSTDSGASWNLVPMPSDGFATLPGTGLTAFATSSDGRELAASWADTQCASDPSGGVYLWHRGQVYISANSGATWTVTAPPSAGWYSLAMSADGYRVAAGSSDGQVCLLPYAGPWRSVGASNEYDFTAVATSADGRKLVAGSNYGLIYTSSDSGTNWSSTSAPANDWTFVASSAEGTKLLAAAYGDRLYVSSNSGASWMAGGPSNYWSSVASSADGSKLVAASYLDLTGNSGTGRVYFSADSGATWTATSAPGAFWTAVASSADGSKLVASEALSWGQAGSGRIHLSVDSGISWTLAGAPSNYWVGVASSGDGKKLVAVSSGSNGGDGLIYTSSDSGISWSHTTVPTNDWYSITSSADGMRLVALGAGYAYLSTDSGATWISVDPPAGASWSAITSSADGNRVVAAGGPIGILRWPLPPPPAPPSPQLFIGRSGADVGLSWLVPSTSFLLQESSGLTSPSWVEVANQLTLNLTNLHNQLILPPRSAHTFYRLTQP
jgi:hypothetical protein